MFWYDHGMGGWGWIAMSFSMVLLVALAVAVVVLFLRSVDRSPRARRSRRLRPPPSSCSPNGSPEARSTKKSTNNV